MWFGVHHAAKVMLAQAKTNTESAEAAVPRPKLPKVSEPKALSVSCVAFCHVCVLAVFADEKVAELLTKIDMPIFVWLQAIWSSEKQHPSLLLAVDVAWHSMARSGHSRAGQGYVYVKAAVFGKPMRPKDRTDKELIELIHQVQLEGLKVGSRNGIALKVINGLDFHILLKLDQSKWAPGHWVSWCIM